MLSKETVAKYWIEYGFCHNEKLDWDKMIIEPEEATTHCWRCGRKTSHLQFCHIVPASLGGQKVESNIILLCQHCHEEGPNINNPSVMLTWLYNGKDESFCGIPDTYYLMQGLKEFKKLYELDFLEELQIILANIVTEDNKTEILIKVKTFIEQAYAKTSIHWGKPYNNSSTIAGILAYVIQEIKKLDKCNYECS